MMFLSILIFTAVILFLFHQKKRREDETYAYSEMMLPTIATLVISAIFFNLASVVGNSAYSYLFDKKYDATVVAYEDLDESRMAVMEFKNDQNELLRKSVGYGSSDPIEIGKKIKVSYENGDRHVKVQSYSQQKVMVAFTVFFFLVFGLATLGMVLYVLDKDISFIFKIGVGFVMYLIFPAGMLFFIGVLSWVIWEYFQGRRDDMPIWALGICSLFVTILIPAFFGYLKMLFDKGSNLHDM
ncbi:hypothetical protein [Kaistella jeonii]|uniref:Uncharacterized protein n=1 Tax=Kaistella jeonii TaxID=266749 RepID=A0A0C1FBP1_9FLAO|nr:hypothetical protein [Kaistella jeonii]KIA85449.1 hypothetical protein OA86_14715 [Kaistella jeonii]SFC42627.1 hypothetical protein SAMN05421876_12112 [Kaistella jeonii]VEI96804.1 Uncharacterised protein [Kaistella jeonii]